MTSSLAKPLAFVALVVGIFLYSASPALAHTDFESSDPADQAELNEVLSELRLTFAGIAEPAGEGFVILDGNGTVREPSTVTTEDQLTYLLTFDPPLAGGQIGVRWSVAAPDAHPIEGAFSFTINASLPSPSADDQPVAKIEDEASGNSAAADATPDTDGAAVALDDFLDEESGGASLAGLLGTLARSLVVGGALIAIGGVIFAALVMRGTEGELAMVVTLIRIAAYLIVVGAAAELITQLAAVNGDWATLTPISTVGEVLVSAFGVAVALKILGGTLMSKAALTIVTASETLDPVVQLRQLVPVGAGPDEAALPLDAAPPVDGGLPNRHNFVWRSHSDSLGVPAGMVAVLAAFLFDGHTVSEGDRIVTGIVDVVHVAAGAIWAGGLVTLTLVIWRRHRRGDDSRALQLAVRFSVVAALALVVAGVAGSVLTVIILDSVSDLWTTTWGQVLILKTLLVAVAGAAGFYNHRVLIPKMAAAETGDEEAEHEFRRAISIEGLVIASVIVSTAVLVGASSV
ncbi:MAG: copper resistance protein CopC/CopD [Acidimicrobiia bacterium]|nr:copper resistance protein CopC/CopD [Acidimicrobiia bacterium]